MKADDSGSRLERGLHSKPVPNALTVEELQKRLAQVRDKLPAAEKAIRRELARRTGK